MQDTSVRYEKISSLNQRIIDATVMYNVARLVIICAPSTRIGYFEHRQTIAVD